MIKDWHQILLFIFHNDQEQEFEYVNACDGLGEPADNWHKTSRLSAKISPHTELIFGAGTSAQPRCAFNSSQMQLSVIYWLTIIVCGRATSSDDCTQIDLSWTNRVNLEFTAWNWSRCCWIRWLPSRTRPRKPKKVLPLPRQTPLYLRQTAPMDCQADLTKFGSPVMLRTLLMGTLLPRLMIMATGATPGTT